MNKVVFFVGFLAISIAGICQVQKNIVETRYLRPSITNLFIEPNDSRAKEIVDNFKQTHVAAQFDDHSINIPELRLNLPEMPTLSSQYTIEEYKTYNKKVKQIDSARKAQIATYLSDATNPIIAKWWSRDENGDFSEKLVAQRGEYTATDADAIAAKSSAVDRRSLMGEDLISKSYIFLYNIIDVKSMDQYYNEQKTKPEDRDKEGYIVNYSVDIYRVDFNDSVAAVFYNDYWTDASEHDQAKVAKWDSARFPIVYVKSFIKEIKSNQPKDPESVVYLTKKKKSLSELLEEVPSKIQDDAALKIVRKSSSFKVRSSVFQAYPIMAKLGTKESLYLGQRFFLYEIEEKDNGDQKKIRVGVARVKKVAKNDTIADGSSNPSIFRQQGGKSIYEGMLIECRPDFGINVTLGQALASSNKLLGGFNIEANFRVTKFIKVPDLYVGLGLSIAGASKVKMGNVTAGGSTLYVDGDYTDISGICLWGYVSKEAYLTKRGNLYLEPSFGFGISQYSLGQASSDAYSWSAIMMPIRCAIGYNLFPAISFQLKPSFLFNFKYTTRDDRELIQVSSSSFDEGYGLDKLNGAKLRTSLQLVMKLRF